MGLSSPESYFNPRTRVGCDPNKAVTKNCTLPFQSTHPRRVRHSFFRSCFVPCLFQSTHPRRVRRGHGKGSMRSIHNFNPRTRVGCDLFVCCNVDVYVDFNPRTRVGCDDVLQAACIVHPIFQSTHPRRVRQVPYTWPLAQLYFNPRTRVGCDILDEYGPLRVLVFQSTHPRRVRHGQQSPRSVEPRFQSTHPRRVRLGDIPFLPILYKFQSTHPRRVRRGGYRAPRQGHRISIHAPA